jgi:hypothetical protein
MAAAAAAPVGAAAAGSDEGMQEGRQLAKGGPAGVVLRVVAAAAHLRHNTGSVPASVAESRGTGAGSNLAHTVAHTTPQAMPNTATVASGPPLTCAACGPVMRGQVRR